VPGKAPDAPVPPYYRLRLLFGLAPPRKDGSGTIRPEDQAVLDERDRIAALPRDEQAGNWLQAFRRFAALDEMALNPAQTPEGEEWTLFPMPDAEPLVLADLTGIKLEKQNDLWIVSGGVVHNERRSSHVATCAIQELLCALLAGGTAPSSDAGGPRILPESVDFKNATVVFKTDGKLQNASVAAAAFAVSKFDETTGWQSAAIDSAIYSSNSDTVTITLTANLEGKLLRLIVKGTGEHPLLGANLVPLAGSVSDPPATSHNGKDFVFMKTGS
jgi:hypothetical protein